MGLLQVSLGLPAIPRLGRPRSRGKSDGAVINRLRSLHERPSYEAGSAAVSRSFQQAQCPEQPLLLGDIPLHVARERRAVAIVVVRLEGCLGDADIGLAVRRGSAGIAEL